MLIGLNPLPLDLLPVFPLSPQLALHLWQRSCKCLLPVHISGVQSLGVTGPPGRGGVLPLSPAPPRLGPHVGEKDGDQAGHSVSKPLAVHFPLPFRADTHQRRCESKFDNVAVSLAFAV